MVKPKLLTTTQEIFPTYQSAQRAYYGLTKMLALEDTKLKNNTIFTFPEIIPLWPFHELPEIYEITPKTAYGIRFNDFVLGTDYKFHLWKSLPFHWKSLPFHHRDESGIN